MTSVNGDNDKTPITDGLFALASVALATAPFIGARKIEDNMRGEVNKYCGTNLNRRKFRNLTGLEVWNDYARSQFFRDAMAIKWIFPTAAAFGTFLTTVNTLRLIEDFDDCGFLESALNHFSITKFHVGVALAIAPAHMVWTKIDGIWGVDPTGLQRMGIQMDNFGVAIGFFTNRGLRICMEANALDGLPDDPLSVITWEQTRTSAEAGAVVSDSNQAPVANPSSTPADPQTAKFVQTNQALAQGAIIESAAVTLAEASIGASAEAGLSLGRLAPGTAGGVFGLAVGLVIVGAEEAEKGNCGGVLDCVGEGLITMQKGFAEMPMQQDIEYNCRRNPTPGCGLEIL